MNNNHDLEPETLAESDESGLAVWRNEEDGEYVYHIELGILTLHFTSEEWEEFVLLIRNASA